jgi:hypothetical protein
MTDPRKGARGPIDLQWSDQTIEISYLVGDALDRPVPIGLGRGPTC